MKRQMTDSRTFQVVFEGELVTVTAGPNWATMTQENRVNYLNNLFLSKNWECLNQAFTN